MELLYSVAAGGCLVVLASTCRVTTDYRHKIHVYRPLRVNVQHHQAQHGGRLPAATDSVFLCAFVLWRCVTLSDALVPGSDHSAQIAHVAPGRSSF